MSRRRLLTCAARDASMLASVPTGSPITTIPSVATAMPRAAALFCTASLTAKLTWPLTSRVRFGSHSSTLHHARQVADDGLVPVVVDAVEQPLSVAVKVDVAREGPCPRRGRVLVHVAHVYTYETCTYEYTSTRGLEGRWRGPSIYR